MSLAETGASVYLLDGEQLTDGIADDRAQVVLAHAHKMHLRPACGCTDSGVPMYIARVGGKFIVKRMPGTGMAHARSCPSWLPPEQLSGLGQVLGQAIEDDPDSGMTAVRLDFSLTKAGGRVAPAPADGAPSDTVAADGAKLTLRAMLHYLWDDAGFTSWTPRMENRRSWKVISWHLRQAARTKLTKGTSLASKLYVPEPFHPDHKAEIAARRMTAWAPARTQRGSKTTQLMMLVGEVKDIGPSRFGHKMVVKHLPDAPFMLADDITKRLYKTFADDLALWDAHDDHHLIVIATFSVGPTGLASVERLALMCTDSRWLPISNDYDELLISTAAEAGRRFTVGLRYNLAPENPLATLTLTDTDPATALHYSTDTDPAEFAELIESEGLSHWHWDTDEDLPPLPPSADTQRAISAPAAQGWSA